MDDIKYGEGHKKARKSQEELARSIINDDVRFLSRGEVPRDHDIAETPVGIEFGRLARALNELDATIEQLAHKIQPGLSPYATRNETIESENAKSEPRSVILEEIARHVRKVRDLRNDVECLIERVEL